MAATITSANYQGSANGTLTISPGGQTITFPPLPEVTYGTPPFALSATASSGLTVTYTSSDSTVATVSGNLLTIIGPGNAQITASQAGNADFAAATPVSQVLVVDSNTPADTPTMSQWELMVLAGLLILAAARGGLAASRGTTAEE